MRRSISCIKENENPVVLRKEEGSYEIKEN